MSRRFIPAIHDPILTEMNQKWRRTDQEIGEQMGFDKHTIRVHRIRLNLPMNTRPKQPQAPHESSPLPKHRPNPLAVARLWLGKRLVEKPSGYWLDGLPVNLTSIMQAVNRLMKAAGAEQLSQNPTWLV